MRVDNTMIIIVIVTLLLFPVMVLAQDSVKKPFTGKSEDGWFLYYLGKDVAEGYISFERGFAVRGNNVIIASLLDYPKTGKYMIVTEVCDCAGNRYSLLGREDYDKGDKSISQYDNDNPRQTFEAITSDVSRQGILANGLCHRLQGKPASLTEARKYFEDYDKEVRKIRDTQ